MPNNHNKIKKYDRKESQRFIQNLWVSEKNDAC